MNPEVIGVKPQDDYTLILTFDNGEVRVFDVKPYLDYPFFKELTNMDFFRAVKPANGTVEWQGGQDLCPDEMSEDSIPLMKIGV
ncbi:DUF2442 domain-containing protein [Paradesulfitobacterium aromaticivorans]